MRYCFLKTFIACLLFTSTAIGQQSNKQPNVLFIMADDLTMRDLQPYGSTQVKTPNLSRLAKEGVCFDNMFNVVPICAPTRQTLLTGLGPVRNGAYPNHSVIYDGIKTLPVYLKDLGYNTALIGKKHFGPAPSYPFDFLGGRNHDNGKGQDVYLSKAEAYIHASADKPFFLMFTSNQPHGPWNRGDRSQYDASKIKLEPNMIDTKMTREEMVDYFAEITYLDSLVGYCLDMIERTGNKNNTIVMFASEQGNSFPFSKWTLYDQGLRSAFIVRWPGVVSSGTRSNAMVQYTDILPTLIDIAGGNPMSMNTGSKDALGNTGFDGESFKEVLTGRRNKMREYVFGVNTTRGIINGSEAYANRSIRNDRYLLIHNLNFKNSFSNVVTSSPLFKQWMKVNAERAKQYVIRPEEELYDVIKDPWQLNNLAQQTAYKDVKQKLKDKLKEFMKQQGDEGVNTEMQALSRQPRNEGND
ncbi:sulfatase family protein [Niabella ginsengisoli]|uniref:Sulfatase n=1 Tax=Niabella ginsengisoli TaxID=522298 RepID=A0ABS9SG76_9BACT|nr:sulfatase [Niabella ginsengisoli]MCH5597369.1 sulfatase [Niabella ginsengisoli]